MNNGLDKPWEGRVWLNPPFGKGLDRWVEKLAEHGNGMGILPLRSTDTNWFHESIWNKADAVLFARGRMRFYTIGGNESGPCPHASILIAYGKENAECLERASKFRDRPILFRGKFIKLG